MKTWRGRPVRATSVGRNGKGNDKGMRTDLTCRLAFGSSSFVVWLGFGIWSLGFLPVSSATSLAQTSAPAAPIAIPSDAQLDLALRRGRDYLAGLELQAGGLDTRYKDAFAGGAECLAALAELAAGQSSEHPALKPLIERALKSKPSTVYARCVHALLAARVGGKEAMELLADDVQWLVRQQSVSGGWGYGPGHPTTVQQPKWADNANSQMAVLALSEAADAGAKVPPSVWKNALNYWVRGQSGDGGWGYEPPFGSAQPLRKSSYGSMTASGVASLMLLGRKLSAVDLAAAKEIDAAVAKGAKWLAENHSVSTLPQWAWGTSDIYNDYYFIYLYSLARAGDACGWRSLQGRIGWADLAGALIARQRLDGSWSDPEGGTGVREDRDAPVRTAFAIQALALVRRPPLIYKLDLGGPGEYDALNLVAHVRRTLQWPVGWEALSAGDSPAIGEAPILYLSAPAEAFAKDSAKIPANLAAQVRVFVLEGGTLLVNPVGEKASAAAAEFLRALLPEMTAAPLPESHPVYSLGQGIAPDKRVKITGLGDPVRTAVFLLERDLSGAWRANQTSAQPPAFDLAVNLALYATDRTCPAGRMDRYRRLATAPLSMVKSLHAARLRYAGDWNACPQALSRLGQVLAASCSLGVREEPPADLKSDVPAKVRLLWATAAAPPAMRDDEAGRLKQYVMDGGTVFVDAGGGTKETLEAWLEALRKVFGKESVLAIPVGAPFLTGKFHEAAADLSNVTYSAAVASEQPALKQPVLYGVYVGDKLGVIVSPCAVSWPLADVGWYGLKAYSRPDAKRLAANAAILAATRKP